MLNQNPCYVLRYLGVELAQWRLFLAVADEGSLEAIVPRPRHGAPEIIR